MNTYSPSKRLIASIVLCSHTLMSCFNPSVNKQSLNDIEIPASYQSPGITLSSQGGDTQVEQGEIESPKEAQEPATGHQLGLQVLLQEFKEADKIAQDMASLPLSEQAPSEESLLVSKAQAGLDPLQGPIERTNSSRVKDQLLQKPSKAPAKTSINRIRIPSPGIEKPGNELLNTSLDWKSREGHILHALYQGRNSMRATVYDKASSNLVYDLPVYIFPGFSLGQIGSYPNKKLSHYLHINLNLSSRQRQGAVILSQGGLQAGGKEDKKLKKRKIETSSTLGELDKIPLDVLRIIFYYVGSKAMSQVRQLSKAFYKVTTGYNKPELGVGYKPEASKLTDGLAHHTRVLDFESLEGELSPETVPSFPFYRLLGEAINIPSSFWPYLRGTHIQTLGFKSNPIGDAGAIELVKHLRGTQVQTLDLSWNQIGASGAIELAKHLAGTQVQTLNLEANKIGDAGAIELVKHLRGTQVQTLNLEANKIGDAGAIELVKCLKGTQLQTLDLSYNQIGASGAIEIAKHLRGTQIHTLDLSWNQIGASGAIELAKHLAGTQVQTLHLERNQIGASGAIELAKHLRGTQVQTLDLNYNQIGAEGATELVKHLKGTQVQILDLGDNKIGASGAIELAKHLAGTQLQTLNLSSNEIVDAGAIELVKHLAGAQVQTLYLRSNQIGDAGAIELAKHLRGTQVQMLNLGMNKIGATGAIELAKHLQGTHVHTLDLSYNRIDDKTREALKEQYPDIEWKF